MRKYRFKNGKVTIDDRSKIATMNSQQDSSMVVFISLNQTPIKENQPQESDKQDDKK